MLMNIKVQTFKTENELDLSIHRWDAVKDQFMPRFKESGLTRYSCTRVWNRKGQHQLAYVFEYRDKEAMDGCLPIWKDIEIELKQKTENVTIGYRGILIDQYDYTRLSTWQEFTCCPPHNRAIRVGQSEQTSCLARFVHPRGCPSVHQSLRGWPGISC